MIWFVGSIRQKDKPIEIQAVIMARTAKYECEFVQKQKWVYPNMLIIMQILSQIGPNSFNN